ncbi:unnamed protein product [Mytilus coruscus]|uniref:Uncharacterized protein n=1 Tax=Mytilus coruscus TaxID=42192 RepID=A0A6J8B6B1_MYTCO|nr:unnamed protein product [Mytilus coruscus]
MFFEFQTHVVKESEVADHCCTFALSDGTKDYTSSCSHLHQNSCSQCEELDTVLECLMEVSKTINYDNDDQRDDTMYTISEDMARKSVLENLKEDEMLVERDWAMKFIQCNTENRNLIGSVNRGLNWHTETEVRQSGIIEAEVPLQEPVRQVNENEVEPLVNDNTVTMGNQSNDDVDSVSEEEMSKLFSCNECIKTFSKIWHMEKVNTVTINSDNFSPGNSNSDLPQGWALKLRRTVKRFPRTKEVSSRKSLTEGEKTGQV